MNGAARAIRPAIGAAVSAAAGASLWAAGAGTLPLPRGWSGPAWRAWWDAVGPVVAVFSVGRVVLTGLAGVLFVVFSVVAAAISGAGAADRAARLLAVQRLPALGPMVRLALALSASGATAAACGSTMNTSSSALPPAAPVLSNVGPYGGLTAVSPTSEPSRISNSAAQHTSSRASRHDGGPQAAPGPGGQTTPTSTPPVAAAGQARPTAASPDVSRPQPGTTWQVQPGDSLWSIAEATAGVPEDGVAAYWAELVKLNRPTLPVPADPSLLFPGDLVRLPPR